MPHKNAGPYGPGILVWQRTRMSRPCGRGQCAEYNSMMPTRTISWSRRHTSQVPEFHSSANVEYCSPPHSPTATHVVGPGQDTASRYAQLPSLALGTIVKGEPLQASVKVRESPFCNWLPAAIQGMPIHDT